MAHPECIEESVTFPSADLVLEGVLAYPTDQEPTIALLLLTPHPHMGGRMNNNVIEHMARRAAEDGALTLRFNYHGVGNSTSHITGDAALYKHWDDMEKEQRYEELLPDAHAALTYLRHCAGNQLPVVILGYSLGAILVGMLANNEVCHQLIAIAPPNAKATLRDFDHCTVPKLFIAGDNDFAFDKEAFLNLFEGYPSPKSFIEMTDTDHFFRKQEEELFQHILPAIQAHAQQGDFA